VQQRESEPFDTSAPLVELIRRSIPAAARRTGGNPAKRTFQALRVEVNDELGAWHRALPAALDAIAVGGRVVVLAYHSLEDRFAKRTFAALTTSAAPRDLPVVPADLTPKFSLVTRGAEQASPAEVAANPRAKSVRLRAIERTAA
jgi:16S rRNA (cytosine1402-N4)-methyltransferase